MAGNLRLSSKGKEKEKLVLAQIELLEASKQLGNLLRIMAFSWAAREVKLTEIARKGMIIVGREVKLTEAI